MRLPSLVTCQVKRRKIKYKYRNNIKWTENYTRSALWHVTFLLPSAANFYVSDIRTKIYFWRYIYIYIYWLIKFSMLPGRYQFQPFKLECFVSCWLYQIVNKHCLHSSSLVLSSPCCNVCDKWILIASQYLLSELSSS